MHTNPILICFCSILYYKRLRYHIRHYKLERKYIEKEYNLTDEYTFKIKKFHGDPDIAKESEKEVKERIESIEGSYEESESEHELKPISCKIYKKCLVNRWHLFTMMDKNRSLIRYRQQHIKEKKVNLEKENLINRLNFLSKCDISILDCNKC